LLAATPLHLLVGDCTAPSLIVNEPESGSKEIEERVREQIKGGEACG